MKRFLYGFLALILILPILTGCGAKENAGAAAETATEGEFAVLGDEESIAYYLEKLHSGAYDDQKLFNYEDLSQYFTLGQYRGLSYPDDDTLRTEVSEEEVDNAVVLILLNTVVTDEQYTELSEGTVQKYDVAHITYQGVIDGVVQENATTGEEGTDLVIGSGSYIPGFENGLIGKAIGSTVTLDLHFSPYYSDEAAADKDVRFTVTIESVQRPEIPEPTADMINEAYSTTFEDMDAVRAALRVNLESSRASNAQSAVANYLQEKVIAGSTVKSYPEKEMTYYRNHFQAYVQQYADSQEMSLEDYLGGQGYSMEEFQEKQEEYARVSCEADLFVFSIAKKENITASDEEIEALIRGLMENNGDFSSIGEMIDYYNSVYGPFYFENRIISSSVMELIQKEATKETVS